MLRLIVLGSLATLLLVACSSSRDYGPLAVVPDSDGRDEALAGPGTIRIDENCVTLTMPPDIILIPVWYAGDVRWDEENREITFDIPSQDDDAITIRDSDVISLGGGQFGSSQPVDWVLPPHESCRGELWGVGSVIR
jgi:hypothetical protein